jgi:hypothetical protein
MGHYSDLLLTGSAPEQPGPSQSYSSRLLGTPDAASPAIDSNAEPDAPTWLGRRIQDIRGRQDPRFKDTGTVFDQFKNDLEGPTGMAATFGASDAQMGNVVEKALGDKFIRREKDANGYDVFVTKGPNGQEQRGYLNKPGIDFQDVTRGVRGSLPYLLAGGVAGAATKGAGLTAQALAQGAAAGTTSVAGDVAQMPMGSEQGIELPKAAVMSGFGAVGPVAGTVVGSVLRKFWTLPGLIDKATGQLTEKGIAAAKEAGVDPTQITPDFAKAFAEAFAKSGDEAAAATQAGLDRFGIPATRGQITKDKEFLHAEEGMRWGTYGEKAKTQINKFDKEQQDAIRFAALGSDSSGPPASRGMFAPRQGIGEQLNPTRQPGANPFDMQPATLGNSVREALQAAREGARQQENIAWQGTGGLKATQQAFDILPSVLNRNLGDTTIDTQITPAAARMAQELDRFSTGKAPEAVAGILEQKPIKSVDQMRRRLLSLQKSAATPEDGRAARLIYNGYNDWIGIAASKSLLDGDPAAAMQIARARGFTKEVRDLFSLRSDDGTLSPASRQIAKILDSTKADSGEAVIDALLGSQGTRSVRAGTVTAVTNIKNALERFAEPAQGRQAWNDIRLAYWTRLMSGKNGELLGPTAMVSNLRTAFHNQSSLMQTLFNQLEMRQMREFERALSATAYKPPNASGSSYGAANFVKEAFSRLVANLLGGKVTGTALNIVGDKLGISNAFGSTAARRATASIRPTSPNLAPIITAITSSRRDR